MRSRPLQYLFCLLLLSGFLWGVVQLFEIRFARGDVYPSYSTLRSDPLGAQAFYESLSRLSPLQVSRNEIPWHSALHFKDSNATWKTVYEAAGFPVVIERTMGEGTIVLAADSYLLSNEAMRRDRHPEFLAWLVGANRRIVFDETHFGVKE